MALQATSIERCNDGYWTHPELPDMGENVSKAKLAEFESEQGFSIHFVRMEGDAAFFWYWIYDGYGDSIREFCSFVRVS